MGKRSGCCYFEFTRWPRRQTNSRFFFFFSFFLTVVYAALRLLSSSAALLILFGEDSLPVMSTDVSGCPKWLGVLAFFYSFFLLVEFRLSGKTTSLRVVVPQVFE